MRDSERQRERAQGGELTEHRPLLQPLRQPGIPSEAEREVQERAWKRIRGEAARLEEEDREVAEWESREREEEAVAGRKGPSRVTPDPEGDTLPTDREERSPSAKRARGDSDDGWHARGKRRWVEERGEEGAAAAARPTSPSPESPLTDWDSMPWCRGILRSMSRGRSRGLSRVGGRRRWRSWSAT